MRRLEIPETPNAAVPCDILHLMSSAESVASQISHSPTAGAERPSWIAPNRTGTEPLGKEQQREKDHWKPGISKATYKEDTQIRLPARRPYVLSTDDATARTSHSKQQEPCTTSLENSPKTGNLLVPRNVSTSPEVDDASLHVPHTNRELARIALVCANGSSMSAPQIIDWLVRRFPYLQQEQGLWEKSLKATLPLKEFRSNKVTGLGDIRVVYSFANEVYKTRYEEEYRDYITHYSHEDSQQQISRLDAVESTGDVLETTENIPEQHSRVRAGETVENAPARYAEDTWGNIPKNIAYSQQSAALFIPSPASTSSDDDTAPCPFKPTRLSLTRSKTEYAAEIKRETSFHKAYPRSIRTSLEMMTAEEKARKVTEIRARPSRKQLIDSGQRLAHVRRYRRQDAHDESEGAWKPQSVEAKEKPMKGASDCDEPRSLHEVFRLPTNAVPMLHEGNELAFRDGTMVSEAIATLVDRYVNNVNRSMADYHDRDESTGWANGWELGLQSIN
ncbi:hypothetical protein yc1106_03917 [Curvularia clavata]|uniref:Fork-head domain-containing protein n=1 Tax=Curvularia clavata TaxID=95742 RepID=A0A9Q9DQR0_CURCL|nr:hypothetical protein yc1106_03917 [Curvularia clavata]